MFSVGFLFCPGSKSRIYIFISFCLWFMNHRSCFCIRIACTVELSNAGLQDRLLLGRASYFLAAVVVAIEPWAEQPQQAELLHHAEVTRVT